MLYDRDFQNLSEAYNDIAPTLEKIHQAFPEDIAQFKAGEELSEELYGALFDYYLSSGEMPYGVAKARSGDPYHWVSEKFEKDCK